MLVTADTDEDSASDPAVTLTHRASVGGYDGVVAEVRVTIAEKGRPPVVVVVERIIPDQTVRGTVT